MKPSRINNVLISEVNRKITITLCNQNYHRKKCPEWNFNSGHTQLIILAAIVHILIYIQSIQIPSTNIRNNEPTDEDAKEATEKIDE